MKVILGILLWIFVICGARAHSWYPAVCCSDADCMELDSKRVRVTPGGYLIDNREMVPFDKAQWSRDEHYHGCFPPAMQGKVGCFWAPRPAM